MLERKNKGIFIYTIRRDEEIKVLVQQTIESVTFASFFLFVLK
jgi:hypothetical protein